MSSTTAQPASPAARARGLGRIGIWSMELRFGDSGQCGEAAAELDELGFGAVWIPGAVGGDALGDVARLLAATRRTVIATGILNIWKHEPAEVGAWWAGLADADHARLMLGLGVSHGPLIGESYAKPLEVMSRYLDGLDAAGLPAERRCLAALGPKMLELAAARSAGAHPYLVPPEHTALARQRMGPSALLAPEQGVILESDPGRARELARQALAVYLPLPNYRNNWRRLGFTEAEIEGLADRLLDALFAWGTPDQIAARARAHLDAGADHVCLQVVHAGMATMTPPREAWRELAKAAL
ncbi:MAG TPA: LLM class F420-dependent oxidoreductase [Myxococcales bacterium]